MVSPSTLVFCTKKTDCHDITEILLKVALNTTTLTPYKLANGMVKVNTDEHLVKTDRY
jgi:hypothetical protein